MAGGLRTLFLCGDVMLGRGVDQILANPGDPELREGYTSDARSYVRLAEQVNGPIPQPVSFSWPWGDALKVINDVAPDVRVINLETSVTRSADFMPGKAVHYRMSPGNLPSLAAARPDGCVLANNHVLDLGRSGLRDTLDTLASAGLRAAGAGQGIAEARRPAVVPVAGGGRAVVFSCGAVSSGIPASWAATVTRSGIDFLPSLSDEVADDLVSRVLEVKRPGDIAVVSVHWGSNWGYAVHEDQLRFARRLIDGGVDLIHGHSSHHPRPIEIYRSRLILYGCGDCIDDYEGIGSYGQFRNDLRLLYFASVRPDTGKLDALRMVPMQARKMRLCHTSSADSEWLHGLLNTISTDFSCPVGREPDGALIVRPPSASVAAQADCSGPLALPRKIVSRQTWSRGSEVEEGRRNACGSRR